MRMLLLGLLLPLSIAQAGSRCLGGGEGGGIPFSLVPQGVVGTSHYVKTHTLLRDFLFWEKSNAVLYSDQSQNYRLHDLSDSSEKKVIVSTPFVSLSKIVDTENRYFTVPSRGVLFDTQTGSARRLPHAEPQTEIFWQDSILYSFPTNEKYSVMGISTIYAYDVKANRLNSCNVKFTNTRFHPAEQSGFPYLFGFQQEAVENGKFKVITMKIDVTRALKNKRCVIEGHSGYKEDFPGQVLALYHYEDLNANIFTLYHPTQNLLWDLGKEECTYYNIQEMEYSVLRGPAPLLALWNERESLNLLYPRRTQRRRVPDMGQFGFESNDFAVSRDGKQLFVSQRPEANSGSLKMLYSFQLDEIP